MMYQGIVQSIDVNEGKGYIREESGELIMFLLNSDAGQFSGREESKVFYNVIFDDGRQAVNVRVID